MRNRLYAALAAVLAASLTATAARASVYQVVFTGHLTTLADANGLFGTAPGGLIGASVRVVEHFDDAAPGVDIRHTVDGYGSQYGVYGAGVANATVQINGHDFAFAGNSSGAMNRVNFLRPGFPSYDGIFTNLSGTVPGATAFVGVYATSTTVDFLEQSSFGDFYGSPVDFTTGPSATDSLGSFRIDYVQGNPVVGDFKVDRIVVSGTIVPDAVVRRRGRRGTAA